MIQVQLLLLTVIVGAFMIATLCRLTRINEQLAEMIELQQKTFKVIRLKRSKEVLEFISKINPKEGE